MKSLLLACAILGVSTALSTTPRDARRLRKHHRSHVGDSHRAIPAPQKHVESPDSTANDEYYNWSGAIQTAAAGETITGVAASFTVPTPSVPDGQPAGSYSGAAWIGIDGADGTPSLWQAGADWSVDTSSGSAEYHYAVWYEWIPNYLIEIENFPVNAGDVINVNLVSNSDSTGTVVISDETTGQTTTIATSAPNPTATLQGLTAEWITEDLSVGGGLAPFANYGSVVYTDTSYSSTSGTYDSSGATLADLIDQSGNVISQASRGSGSEIDTNYV